MAMPQYSFRKLVQIAWESWRASRLSKELRRDNDKLFKEVYGSSNKAKPVERKHCSVYFRDDDIYITSSSQTIDGFLIGSEPRFKLKNESSAASLGATVMTALECSRQGVPTPDLGSVGAELLEFTGFKNFSSFEKGAIYFSVGLTEEGITIDPTTPGKRGGFVFHRDSTIHIENDPDKLGEVLLKLSRGSSMYDSHP